MDKNQEKEADKKSYELSFLIQKEETANDILRLLGQHGIEVVSQPTIKKISLAYKISRVETANFGFAALFALPADIKSLEGDLKSNADILRFMIVNMPKREPVSEHGIPPRRPLIRKSIRPAPPREQKTVSNEVLEKKIEEILK